MPSRRVVRAYARTMREPVRMSVRQMSLVFEHSHSRGAARLVLLALADVAADDGQVTAYRRSQSVLARKANVSGEGVRKAIHQLVELGELQVLVRGSGRRRSDYQLRVGPTDEGPTMLGADPSPGGGQPPPELGSITSSLDITDTSRLFGDLRKVTRRL